MYEYTNGSLHTPSSRGIRIGIVLNNFEFSKGACLPSRMILIVDGVQISDASMIMGIAQEAGSKCNEGQFFLSWLPKLDIGDHKVIFLLIDDNGVVWEKSWEFKLYP